MYLLDKQTRLTLLAVFVGLSCSIVINASDVERRFPKDFLWGVGTSAYQIEGGWNADDKGESIWDRMTHQIPEIIADRSNGDIACDSYHKWREDVQLLRQLNVNIYRFSIAWSRVVPTGYINHVSDKGIQYYSNLIDELLKYNITPMVTMYHWDLPQRLQELGGWTNPEIIPLFQDYARILFEKLGDRVKIWTTFNEPWQTCEQGYSLKMAPAYEFPGIPVYLCGHNLLKAHAEVVHMYRDIYQSQQKGKITITIDSMWAEPKTNSDEDKASAERVLQFHIGWLAHPIYSKSGNYPQVLIDRIARISKEQGFTDSRLPQFTPEEIDRIRGTSDFFGLNTYTTLLYTSNDENNVGNFSVPSIDHDMGAIGSRDPTWPGSGSIWLKVVPFGISKLITWIKDEYNNPPIMVTENGVSDKGELEDNSRVDYYNSYLTAVLDAIDQGANVIGYVAWSLIDNFEWNSGYTEKFGLFHVDFTHPDRKRTPKLSSKVFANICKTNTIDLNYRPELEPEDGSAGFNTLSFYLVVAVILVNLMTM